MRVVAVACQGPTQETSRDHRIHGPRIPGKWCERSRSGLALEVVYVGGPWRYFWRFPTLGHRGGISLGQCKSCCMISLPLNLFQERRCYVFSPSCYIHFTCLLKILWGWAELIRIRIGCDLPDDWTAACFFYGHSEGKHCDSDTGKASTIGEASQADPQEAPVHGPTSPQFIVHIVP